MYFTWFIFQISEILKKGTIPVLIASAALGSTSLQNDDSKDDSDIINFHSLQYALFVTSFVEVLGALFFFFAASHIIKDKELAETETPGWPNYTPIVN